ncbi:hypothetical protein BESB_028310 [Besnoitia besnoiti]|uniref:Uncharacterized protein n=1 Tax=Besnoitia besnoiti TaxID=94643 RepID=A0A2A9M692_BESBE|nr:uncharacterized protein BESB_028310 [Besnoitia besnoiti]PFH31396.1 hypothetical protein BESB_028310 [Besnoitia besnoiti]
MPSASKKMLKARMQQQRRGQASSSHAPLEQERASAEHADLDESLQHAGGIPQARDSPIDAVASPTTLDSLDDASRVDEENVFVDDGDSNCLAGWSESGGDDVADGSSEDSGQEEGEAATSRRKGRVRRAVSFRHRNARRCAQNPASRAAASSGRREENLPSVLVQKIDPNVETCASSPSAEAPHHWAADATGTEELLLALSASLTRGRQAEATAAARLLVALLLHLGDSLTPDMAQSGVLLTLTYFSPQHVYRSARQAAAAQSTSAARGQAAVLVALSHFLYREEAGGASREDSWSDKDGQGLAGNASGDKEVFLFLEARVDRLIPIHTCWRPGHMILRVGGPVDEAASHTKTSGEDAAHAEERRSEKREDATSEHALQTPGGSVHGPFFKISPTATAIVSGAHSSTSTVRTRGLLKARDKKGPLTKDEEKELILLLQALQILGWTLSDREKSNWISGPGAVLWRCGASALLDTATGEASNLLPPDGGSAVFSPRSIATGRSGPSAETEGEPRATSRLPVAASSAPAAPLCPEPPVASLSVLRDAGLPRHPPSTSSTFVQRSDGASSASPCATIPGGPRGSEKEAAASTIREASPALLCAAAEVLAVLFESYWKTVGRDSPFLRGAAWAAEPAGSSRDKKAAFATSEERDEARRQLQRHAPLVLDALELLGSSNSSCFVRQLRAASRAEQQTSNSLFRVLASTASGAYRASACSARAEREGGGLSVPGPVTSVSFLGPDGRGSGSAEGVALEARSALKIRLIGWEKRQQLHFVRHVLKASLQQHLAEGSEFVSHLLSCRFSPSGCGSGAFSARQDRPGTDNVTVVAVLKDSRDRARASKAQALQRDRQRQMKAAAASSLDFDD